MAVAIVEDRVTPVHIHGMSETAAPNGPEATYPAATADCPCGRPVLRVSTGSGTESEGVTQDLYITHGPGTSCHIVNGVVIESMERGRLSADIAFDTRWGA